jgi:hypothetical protein
MPAYVWSSPTPEPLPAIEDDILARLTGITSLNCLRSGAWAPEVFAKASPLGQHTVTARLIPVNSNGFAGGAESAFAWISSAPSRV